MAVFKVILFCALLVGFFLVSGIWHWVCFGAGKGFVNNRLVPRIFSRAEDRQAAAPIIETAIKVSLTVLVAADLVGLYLMTYWLLG